MEPGTTNSSVPAPATTRPTATCRAARTIPTRLFLGPGYLGFASFADIPGANFFIGTLPGGKRDWDGIEGIFRKRFSDHWQMIASYAYADAEGNTNSDSNADFQGDVLWLDPRAPNQLGTQPGLIENLAKVAGSYQFDNGIQLGATGRWNSGTKASRTFRLFSRNLPVVAEGIDFADVNSGFGPDTWIEPGAVGGLTNDSWTTVDLRVAYLWNISERFETNFFLDVLNAFDDQAAIRNQDLEAGLSGFDFGEGHTVRRSAPLVPGRDVPLLVEPPLFEFSRGRGSSDPLPFVFWNAPPGHLG